MKEPVFTPEYFYDEVREGFFIPEMMKRFWAAQLVVLYEIVKICERHDIPWYADMGTLLGAIRHKGYVPWDDDIDISMKREDWELFFKYAQDELPEGYCVLNVWTNEEYGLSVGRITCSNNIDFNKEHMEKFHGCPYCVGVDVYPIDRLYKDTDKEQKRKDRGKAVKRAYDLISLFGMGSVETQKALAGVERDNQVIFHRKGNIRRELILLFEKICMECKDDNYDQVALMYTWIIDDWANCPRYLYEDRTELPFENTSLMATIKYDKLLTIYYHDYMTVKKGGGAHEYPIYKAQEKLLKGRIGHNPYRYTFTKNELNLHRKEKTLKERCFEIFELIKDSTTYGKVLAEKGEHENMTRIFSGCQELAITLGTLIEDKYGDDCEVVKRLEEYCELLYQATQEQSDTIEGELDAAQDGLKKGLEGLFDKSVKEIVFLPCRSVWWYTMKPLYEKLSRQKNVNIHVIPLPYYDRDPYGNTGEKHDESEYYRSLAGYTGITEYNIEKKHPDIVVMQVPFDGCSCSITVPKRYYSGELLKVCDELWYIPCFDPDPPQSPDDKAAVSISVLIEQPAVINADKVIIDNETMRDFYIKTLTDMAGEDTGDYWKKKICGIENLRG